MFVSTNNAFHFSDFQTTLEELLKLMYMEPHKEDGQKNQQST